MRTASGPALPSRSETLDGIRGIAVVIMIFYHLTFDFRVYGVEFFAFLRTIPWWKFRLVADVIGTLFTVSSGAAFFLSRVVTGPRHEVRPLWKNTTAQLAAAAALVTIGTAVFDKSNVILFGILHFLLVGRLLLPAFMKWRPRSLLIGAAVLIALGELLGRIHPNTLAWVWLGLSPRDWKTGDYFPLIPWFGALLAGLAWGHILKTKTIFTHRRWPRGLIWLGRNSLVIYLLHQPALLFGLRAWGLIRF